MLGWSRRAAAEGVALLADVDPVVVEAVQHQRLASSDAPVLTTGLGASAGVAVGRVAYSSARANDLLDEGDEVILVRPQTTPEDEPTLRGCAGVLTAEGGLASHAAVIARGLGIVAVCGAPGVRVEDPPTIGGVAIPEGTVVSLDGTTGAVMLGAVEGSGGGPELAEAIAVLAQVADEARRGRVAVLANVDTAADAQRAVDAGAEGVGLYRVEHLFLGERLPVLQDVIAADGGDDPGAEEAALARLAETLRDDLTDLLAVMGTRPVTIRLLDPPLHEFLADHREGVGADPKLAEAAARWHEVNPMLGTRGVRLALLRPALLVAQVEAICSAVAAHPTSRVKIMVPLVALASEMEEATGRIRTVVAERLGNAGALPVGCMIETPRAVLVAADLAHHAEFFSLGTNDLTQLTFGFSRDDTEHRLFARYAELGVLPDNPFAHLDPAVAELVALTVARGRSVATDLPVGVCGEHGGDARSIPTLLAAGVDSVSCSTPRLVLARIAVGCALAAFDRRGAR